MLCSKYQFNEIIYYYHKICASVGGNSFVGKYLQSEYFKEYSGFFVTSPMWKRPSLIVSDFTNEAPVTVNLTKSDTF